MEKNIEELTLLLMYLTSWEDEGYVFDDKDNLNKVKVRVCWKGYNFDTLNNLTDTGYLYHTKNKNKTVTLTPEGEKQAKILMEKYLKR